LLEAARLLSAEAGGLRRSLLFVSFCAEELGLIGSTYFMEHLPIAKEKIRMVINMDMIGRNNMDKAENEHMFIVFSSAQTPALEAAVRAQAKAMDLDVRVAPYVRFHGASDHVIFHDAGIPVVHYFGGFHSDYNMSSDTADKLVPGKMAAVVRHLCRLVSVVSDDDKLILEFDSSISKEPEKDSFENPYSR
ncbi:MAG: M28 family peptidase, partial [Candidatus Latescibacterota bacterium]